MKIKICICCCTYNVERLSCNSLFGMVHLHTFGLRHWRLSNVLTSPPRRMAETKGWELTASQTILLYTFSAAVSFRNRLSRVPVMYTAHDHHPPRQRS